MVTGSAPIKKDVQVFMQAIMACPMIEGYGQTENTGGAFITSTFDPESGHVGGIVVLIIFIYIVQLGIQIV